MMPRKSKEWKLFQENKSKGSLWEQFADSASLRPILIKWLPVKPRKAKLCECGSVGYKTLSNLTIKQMNIILSLCEVVAHNEKEVEQIRNEAIEELDKKDDFIKALTKRLEVMKHVN